MPAAPTILVFDSGLGGLTVFREIAALRRDARFIYAADDEAFPYGHLSEQALALRVTAVMAALLDSHHPDLVIVACNTASTLVLSELRQRFSVPFVGTVPAIKPACMASQSKRVSVLGTEATVTREYTKALIRDYRQGCDVALIGSKHLAVLAEGFLRGEAIDDAAILEEISPCFTARESARTDVIVLACTHYPLLLDHLTRLSPWPVTFVDPAPAVARRAVDLIGAGSPNAPMAPRRIVFTSGRPVPAALGPFLSNLGFDPPQQNFSDAGTADLN